MTHIAAPAQRTPDWHVPDIRPHPFASAGETAPNRAGRDTSAPTRAWFTAAAWSSMDSSPTAVPGSPLPEPSWCY